MKEELINLIVEDIKKNGPIAQAIEIYITARIQRVTPIFKNGDFESLINVSVTEQKTNPQDLSAMLQHWSRLHSQSHQPLKNNAA